MKMAVISQHRFDPDTIKVHDLIEAQAFGRLVLGNALIPWWRSQAYYDSGAWRGTWKLDGGGVLMNQSIHSIDLLLWLMAQNSAVLAIRSHALQIEDMIQAVRENGTPLVDGYAAKHPAEIILGIYGSARTHQEVTLS